MDESVDDIDDDWWLDGGMVERRKKVGISSLSKKMMIRQARADYALVPFELV